MGRTNSSRCWAGRFANSWARANVFKSLRFTTQILFVRNRRPLLGALERSSTILGTLGRSWAVSGPLGRSWSGLGAVLGRSWRGLEELLGGLGAPWERLEPVLARLGAVLGAPRGRFSAVVWPSGER